MHTSSVMNISIKYLTSIIQAITWQTTPMDHRRAPQMIGLWECSKASNTKILQRIQSKTLRMVFVAPWYVSNQTFHHDLKIPFISEAIRIYVFKSPMHTLTHNKPLIINLYSHQLLNRRLKR